MREAGDAVAQRAPAGAARWYAAALRLLPGSVPTDQRVPLILALAVAHAATGRFAEARETLLESLRTARAWHLGLVAACAGVEQLLGLHDEAQARLERALGALDDPASPEAATLMLDLGIGAFYRLEFPRSREWAARALPVASALGRRPLTAAATALLAMTGSLVGPGADADRRCTEAAALVDAMPDDELADRLDAAANVAAAESNLERFEAAVAHARRGIALARATGQGELLPMLFPALATAMLGLGRLQEGAELMDGAIEGARLTGNVQALAWNLLNRSMLATLAGDLDVALRTADEAVAQAGAIGSDFVAAYARAAEALVLMELGDHAAGIEQMVRSGGGEELPLPGGGWRAVFLDRLTRAQLALGERAAAETAAAAAETVAAATALRHAAALARRGRASMDLDAGRAAAAADAALGSAALADEIGARSTARCRASSPAARWSRRASARARRASSRPPPARSTHAAPSAPARRRSGSCASSGAASSGRRARASATARRSRRSPSASWRSPGWSSIARPTRRSRPSCSSAARRSRPTCTTSSPSSTCPRASRSRARSSAPGATRTARDGLGRRDHTAIWAPTPGSSQVRQRAAPSGAAAKARSISLPPSRKCAQPS
jgi:tetratricopeptide (TPR) repeat protein